MNKESKIIVGVVVAVLAVTTSLAIINSKDPVESKSEKGVSINSKEGKVKDSIDEDIDRYYESKSGERCEDNEDYVVTTDIDKSAWKDNGTTEKSRTTKKHTYGHVTKGKVIKGRHVAVSGGEDLKDKDVDKIISECTGQFFVKEVKTIPLASVLGQGSTKNKNSNNGKNLNGTVGGDMRGENHKVNGAMRGWKVDPTLFQSSDKELLAHLVMSEAGDQPYEGKLAVANTVINRVKKSGFLLRDVIFSKHQFDGTQTKWFLVTPEPECYKASEEALAGKNVVPTALHFADLNLCDPSWAHEFKFIRRIGDHWFFE